MCLCECLCKRVYSSPFSSSWKDAGINTVTTVIAFHQPPPPPIPPHPPPTSPSLCSGQDKATKADIFFGFFLQFCFSVMFTSKTFHLQSRLNLTKLVLQLILRSAEENVIQFFYVHHRETRHSDFFSNGYPNYNLRNHQKNVI